MSLNSTPGHTSSSSFESFYDPSFTAEITSKMYVPDSIYVVEGAERSELYSSKPEEVKMNMNIPDRIIVAGGDKHIEMKETLPELKYETRPYQFPNYILAPPPDVLTVEEYPYSAAETNSNSKTMAKKPAALDQSITSLNEMNESSMSTTYAPEEEIAILRRQVRHLCRRVLTIEQENQQRQQREIIMYALGVTYFFFKGLIWLHRHF